MARKKTLNEFIADARNVHGDKYDYSDVCYVNRNTNILIRCNICGKTFPQTPNNHLNGAGCPHCAHFATSKRQTIHVGDVIEKLKEQWKDVYDFSFIDESNYKGKKYIVQVICKKHGVFPTRLADLENGHGCPHCAREHLKGKSNIKNKKLVCGVGINDYDVAVYTNEEVVKEAYKHWHAIILRCYSKNCSTKYPSYIGCTVCDKWLRFSNFFEWFKKQWSSSKKNYHVDKDILFKGNKVYSPETCCFVPPYINQLLEKCKGRRGNLPIGVFYDKQRDKYGAALSENKNTIQKRFETIKDAFSFYKKAKEAYIKEVAQKYYDKREITKRVYDALMKYEVEITD